MHACVRASVCVHVCVRVDVCVCVCALYQRVPQWADRYQQVAVVQKPALMLVAAFSDLYTCLGLKVKVDGRSCFGSSESVIEHICCTLHLEKWVGEG